MSANLKPILQTADTDGSFCWRVNSRSRQAAIRREKLGDGLFMTHSLFRSDQSLVSRFDAGARTATFVFMVKGHIRVKPADDRPWTDMRQAHCYAFSSEDTRIFRETPANQQMEALIIKISAERLKTICDDLGGSLPRGLVRSATPLARSCPAGAKNSLARLLDIPCGNATARLLAQARAIELIGELLFTPPEGLRDREKAQIRELGAYLTTHLDRSHNLEALAAMAAMNHVKLNRLFKTVHGCTVFDFIRRERLRKAERCLRETDLSITEIAHAAGFCSSSHFCGVFRREHGLSPRAFRARGRG